MTPGVHANGRSKSLTPQRDTRPIGPLAPAPEPPRSAAPIAGRPRRRFFAARRETSGARRRRPHLFALMLGVFVLVILLGMGGMFAVYSLAVSGANPIWSEVTTIDGTIPLRVSGGPDPAQAVRGFISASLALAAVLLGLATFFSSRFSRPLVRLTGAARRMAAGDMSVRVGPSAVREIDDLSSAFNNMAADIARADQQRRQLTADVAHELRTPLSIIRGRLEGMQDGVYRATPEQIGILLHETAMLERLIEDLRLLALAEAGQLPLYHTPFEPGALLRDVAAGLETQAAAAGVRLKVVAPDNLPDVLADPQRVAQVLGNLVANALRHTAPGGSVVLSAAVLPGASRRPLLRMAVGDTGCGIPPEDLPHIFDRFWRADRSRTRASGGTGLGLAIARRIVEAHGGEIWASSIPGQGTTVSFSLPVDQGS